MSSFYKPHRNPNWNYSGPNWKLSRSKIDLFIECPKCFYIDNKLGVARPPGYPFNLNSAVDHLLKKEFDVYRANGTPHPLAAKYNVNAIPFRHAQMDNWRENFTGVQFFHKPTGMTISGAVDDIWIDENKHLIVVDYKSTSKDEDMIALDKDWHDGYKRQMEVYQWLLRQNGFTVSNTGYFVYANGKKDRVAFDAKLEFDVTLIAYTGDDNWVEPTIFRIKETLDSDLIPPANSDCDYCRYRDAVAKVLNEAKSQSSLYDNHESNSSSDSHTSGHLF